MSGGETLGIAVIVGIVALFVWCGSHLKEGSITTQCDQHGYFYIADGVRYRCSKEEWKP